MNVISKLDLKEFRGIKECESPLEFKDFSVIIGRNNSGKSAVLEALSLAPFRDVEQQKHHVDNWNQIQLIQQIHKATSPESLVYRYSGTARIDCVYQNVMLKMMILNGRKIRCSGADEAWTIPGDVDNILVKGKVSGPPTDNVVFIPNNSLFLERVLTSLGRSPFPEAITKSGANTTIVNELINPYVNDIFSEILWDGGTIKLRKQYSDGTLSYINVSDLGDGMKKVLIIAMLLEHLKPEVVLWDDFEGSVHPSLLKKVMEWLASKPWQVIMTTHSIDVLRTLVDIEPEGSEVIMTSKDSEDVLHHKTYPLDDFEEMFYSNTDPRYIADSLGL